MRYKITKRTPSPKKTPEPEKTSEKTVEFIPPQNEIKKAPRKDEPRERFKISPGAVVFTVFLVLLVSVITVLSVLLVMKNRKEAADITSSDKYVRLLPEKSVAGDFPAESASLCGVIYNPSGLSSAIFAFTDKDGKDVTAVAAEGEAVCESTWRVQSVTADGATVSNGSETKTFAVLSTE